MWQTDVGNVRTPDLVDPLDLDAPQLIRVDPVSRRRRGQARAGVDRGQAHRPHQADHALAVDRLPLRREPGRHPA